jgi:hypothetical protein
MNAGQRAGLHGTYEFNRPHSSYRARLRRLKQIAQGRVTPAQIDLTRVDASDLTRSVQQAATGDDFSITYEDDEDGDTRGNDEAEESVTADQVGNAEVLSRPDALLSDSGGR